MKEKGDDYIMGSIISPDNNFNKKNKYICKNCRKHYSLTKLEYINSNKKCEKCGGELVKFDLRTY